MNDPHVEAMHYRVKHSDLVDYSRASPLGYEGSKFSVRIENDKAKIVLKEHYATTDSAREAVEPFLRVWELKAALCDADDRFEFEFQNADIIDRKRSAGYVLSAEGGAYRISGANAIMRIGRASYPTPPNGLAWNDNVDLMMHGYRGFREGRRSLVDACYFCLTVLQGAKGRRPAAIEFRIALDVLAKFGELSSRKGGREARKLDGAHMELTASERAWLEEALKILIRRAAEVANDPKVHHNAITMGDLPPIS